MNINNIQQTLLDITDTNGITGNNLYANNFQKILDKLSQILAKIGNIKDKNNVVLSKASSFTTGMTLTDLINEANGIDTALNEIFTIVSNELLPGLQTICSHIFILTTTENMLTEKNQSIEQFIENIENLQASIIVKEGELTASNSAATAKELDNYKHLQQIAEQTQTIKKQLEQIKSLEDENKELQEKIKLNQKHIEDLKQRHKTQINISDQIIVTKNKLIEKLQECIKTKDNATKDRSFGISSLITLINNNKFATIVLLILSMITLKTIIVLKKKNWNDKKQDHCPK
jgi:hypothetical protein